MKSFSLGKEHKLCSTTAIDCLFASREAASALAYPLRAVWQCNNRRNDGDAPCKFLISVPKKRLRHAVDRVTMRRRIREAYRLNHAAAEASAEAATPTDTTASSDSIGAPRNYDIAFIYVADKLRPYADIECAMRRLLRQIHRPTTPQAPPQQ